MELIFLILVGIIVWWVFTNLLGRKKGITYTYTDQNTGKTKTLTKDRRAARAQVQIEKPVNFVVTEEVKEVLDTLEMTESNVFLTGRAGTGKSTLLKYFRATTSKSLAVVAPTGVAAVNVQGQTIHSFFGWGIGITPDRVRQQSYEKMRLYKNLKMLIIDEISMVRADLFDCIDRFLRLNTGREDLPFGGVQIVAIGDLYQLPPVVTNEEKSFFEQLYETPFFFSTDAFKRGYFRKFELKKVFRQTDHEFVSALNAIREGYIDDGHINLLNTCVLHEEPEDFQSYVHLVTTNKMAKEINDNRMRKLPAEPLTYTGVIWGTFSKESAPTDIELELKVGAQVMLINNDREGRWVNGDIGNVLQTKDNSIIVEFIDGTAEEILAHSWETVRFIFDEEQQKVIPTKVGGFTQIPVKPAWAMTIHKSQGKTFEKMFLDLGTGAFAGGQTYVALSRCKSLNGLKLSSPLRKEDIFVDEHVREFMSFASEATSAAVESYQPRVEVEAKDANGLMEKRDFVLGAIHKLRQNGYKGIHAVYSGFNKAFRDYYNEDPISCVQKLAEQKVVVIRPVKGGVMLYDYAEYDNKSRQPHKDSKGDKVLTKILKKV